MPDDTPIDDLGAAATPPAGQTSARRPKGVLDAARLQVAPTLLGTRLAKPWQRAAAMAIDLVVIACLSLLSHPVLGLLTGATFAVLGTRRESDAKTWAILRWGLIALGAIVIVLSGALLAGKPLVRSGAFNLAAEREAPDLSPVYLPAAPSSADLRDAVRRLDAQVDYLKQENAALRDEIRGNSWLRLAADTSRTMGFTFGWAGVYFTLTTLLLRGRTVGKLILRTRVVRLDGQRLTGMDAFIRNGGYAAGLATGLIGFARLLWDPNRQAIQDRIAGTVVIRPE
ncbi:RDD family protein [Actomonas aquatica]|uniref:RDD family protein n=1 Tax=Actomonas aquatica TaxID=2866162 RepID=A0ABZ1C2L9_9BACT|nr:RDD family protein [Opitutus sp. WL0086]WRQ85681.1 RDD family protein [Opitutus sp. WL0086]